MAQWEGKSRGTVLGYKIFIFFMKKLGLSSAYFILYFVAFYFLFFSPKGTKSSYYYFRQRLHYNALKSIYSVYRSYYKFGQTIIDKVAIKSGLRNRFTYHFDGIDSLKQLIADKKGGILISAHVGNFEIADFFLKEIDFNSEMNIVTTDQEHSDIKEYLESVSQKSPVKLILIKEDFSHIFDINAALAKNELICFTGDRYFDGTRSLEEDLLGEKAKFPAGPFLLASRLKVPVAFVYVMKETNKHYHLFTRLATAKKRDAQGLLQNYTESIEWILKQYPLQWFNYFDFWDKIK
ncbi:lipid A biosynthesis acyltransferase [Aureibaculum marinum]|uniref:Lipid A biosynthesis acyltransferase n=1 Tax=Aureibaculum marinum TaxID=2487930 RepID=A0A3N4NQK8_9FLAO|nr:lipid A biosynthesis acyltransferase [Aureibaculum marinum]RPD98581.1 lipid A biosynthesis acyltransferase [Aureibaculum marinum]